MSNYKFSVECESADELHKLQAIWSTYQGNLRRLEIKVLGHAAEESEGHVLGNAILDASATIRGAIRAIGERVG